MTLVSSVVGLACPAGGPRSGQRSLDDDKCVAPSARFSDHLDPVLGGA